MTSHVANVVGGMAQIELVIQAQTVVLARRDRPDPTLAGLPRCSPTFVGREPELQQVLTALDPVAPESVVRSVVVAGLAGIGKTELMLQAAHQALQQDGSFPGGVVYVNMGGYDAKRQISPKQALGQLLRALGLPAERVPARLEERALVYRSALAEWAAVGRRILVVLDDVPAQVEVRHLLPGDRATAVLMSSRDSLADLDATLLTLTDLSSEAGVRLLRDALHVARGDDRRVDEEAAEAARLVHLCAGHPLALRIVASLLIDVPSRPLRDLREELESSPSRLGRLSREEHAVRAAFDMSYSKLSEDEARLFRLLFLNPTPYFSTRHRWKSPAPDFSTDAAAQLAGESPEKTKQILLALARRHLIEARAPFGRWQQHDLVRLYSAARLAESDEDWGVNLNRLHLWFYELGVGASAALRSSRDPSTEGTQYFADRAAARRWLEDERSSLVAAVLRAHDVGDHRYCTGLALAIHSHLTDARQLEDAAAVLEAGIASARADGESPLDEAVLLSSLGVVLSLMRKLDKSLHAHSQAVEICRKVQDPDALASALNNLGLALHERRQFTKAVAAHTEAEQLFHGDGNLHGSAMALANLGETFTAMGRVADAESALRRAVKIFRELDDEHGNARALGSLAVTVRNRGDVERAVKLHRRALRAGKDLVPPHQTATELLNLASSLLSAGDLKAAQSALKEARAIFRSLGDRRGEAFVHGNMALVCQRRGRWDKAIRTHTRACELLIEIGDDHSLAVEFGNLAQALRQEGRHTEAREHLELATALYERNRDADSARRAVGRAGQIVRLHGAVIEPMALPPGEH
ncbi:tetratricopeptide repeat protein [Streptomyces harbinensis]|uniref:tetratricopeptide repeat protein n=1 Tax=Streptomyces harbinensis TaxID=1176198 RepID=UPI00339A3EA8